MESVNISKLSTTEAAQLSETLGATFQGWERFDFCPALVWFVASVPISGWSSLGVVPGAPLLLGFSFEIDSMCELQDVAVMRMRVGAQEEQRFTPESPELHLQSVLSSSTAMGSVTPNRAHQELKSDKEFPSNKD